MVCYSSDDEVSDLPQSNDNEVVELDSEFRLLIRSLLRGHTNNDNDALHYLWSIRYRINGADSPMFSTWPNFDDTSSMTLPMLSNNDHRHQLRQNIMHRRNETDISGYIARDSLHNSGNTELSDLPTLEPLD